MHLVLLGDRREADDFPLLLREHMANEIVLVQSLHNDDQGAGTFVVEPAVERVAEPIVGRLPLGVGQRILRLQRNEALNEPVVVTENGGRKRISKRQATFKQLVNEAAKGNWRALKLLVDILQDIERRTEPQTEESSFSLADEKVIAQLKARLHGKE